LSKNNFENAFELYQNDAYEESIKIFDDFFSITPSMIESFKNSKSFIFNFKEYRNIISYFNKILEINPDDSEILARKGSLLQILFQYSDSLKCLNKALEINPENSLANCVKGIVLYNMEKFEESLSYFNKILEINSTNIEASLGKGLCLEMLGMREDSVKYFVTGFQSDLTDSNLLQSICFNLVHFCFPINALTYSNYIQKLDSNDPIANGILDLVKPQENKLREKISELYERYLHREPAVTDIDHWEKEVIHGKSINMIEQQIKNSEEGSNYFN
jgi:tetratricopeptide (TPR) repeat protein